MPFIRTTTNVKISAQQRAALKDCMGKMIELIPGKSEQWLMLAWQDETPMAFQGKEDPCALCEVKLYGAADPAACDRLTGALCQLMESELGVAQSRVYVTYQELDKWGFDGGNF